MVRDALPFRLESCPMPEVADPPVLAPPAPRSVPAPPARRPGRRGLPSAEKLRDLGLPPDGTAVSAAEHQTLSLAHNLLVEWVDGRLEYLPMPSRTHQRIVLDFAGDLRAHARSAGLVPDVLVAPFILWANGRRREPDVCFLKDRDDSRGGENSWTGADLLAEIVSPDDPLRDTRDKRIDYAAAGVLEYWIVDPRPAFRTVTVLTLDGPEYREHGLFRDGDAAAGPLLPGFAVDVTACLDAR